MKENTRGCFFSEHSIFGRVTITLGIGQHSSWKCATFNQCENYLRSDLPAFTGVLISIVGSE